METERRKEGGGREIVRIDQVAEFCFPLTEGRRRRGRPVWRSTQKDVYQQRQKTKCTLLRKSILQLKNISFYNENRKQSQRFY